MSSSRGTLGRAEQDAPIYFDDIFCEGDELFLSQCHHHLLDNNFGFPWFCGSHYYDAGVICQGKRCHTCTQSIMYMYVMLIIMVLFVDNIDFTRPNISWSTATYTHITDRIKVLFLEQSVYTD